MYTLTFLARFGVGISISAIVFCLGCGEAPPPTAQSNASQSEQHGSAPSISRDSSGTLYSFADGTEKRFDVSGHLVAMTLNGVAVDTPAVVKHAVHRHLAATRRRHKPHTTETESLPGIDSPATFVLKEQNRRWLDDSIRDTQRWIDQMGKNENLSRQIYNNGPHYPVGFAY